MDAGKNHRSCTNVLHRDVIMHRFLSAACRSTLALLTSSAASSAGVTQQTTRAQSVLPSSMTAPPQTCIHASLFSRIFIDLKKFTRQIILHPWPIGHGSPGRDRSKSRRPFLPLSACAACTESILPSFLSTLLNLPGLTRKQSAQ
jgi:hypothetical protein